MEITPIIGYNPYQKLETAKSDDSKNKTTHNNAIKSDIAKSPFSSEISMTKPVLKSGNTNNIEKQYYIYGEKINPKDKNLRADEKIKDDEKTKDDEKNNKIKFDIFGRKVEPNEKLDIYGKKIPDDKNVFNDNKNDKKADLTGKKDCESCKNRKYVDGSNDPGVSFKFPSKVSPELARAAVSAHEQQHVSHNLAKAVKDNMRIVSQTVSLHNAICKECGRNYVSGGTTHTVTAPKSSYSIGIFDFREIGKRLNKKI